MLRCVDSPRRFLRGRLAQEGADRVGALDSARGFAKGSLSSGLCGFDDNMCKEVGKMTFTIMFII